MKRLLMAAAVALIALPAAAQQQIDFSKAEVTTKDLGHGLHYLESVGANLLFLVGSDNVLLIDSNYAQMVDKITAAIAKVTDKPVKYVINTHIHPDHLGGNEALAKAGALIIAHKNVRIRMEEGMSFFGQTIPPAPTDALPALTLSDAEFYFGGNKVILVHAPKAHTDSDIMIYFDKANAVHTGGVFGNNRGYPFVDISAGGSLDGVIEGQAKLLSVIDDKTKVFADQGPAVTKKDVKACHDMLVQVRERIQALIDQGKSEDEAVAAKPTADFDKKWAPQGTFLNGEFMTRQAYRSLTGVAPPSPQPAATAN